MPDKRDVILYEMTKVYIMFCLPRVTLNTKTKEVSVEYIWQNDDAKKNYELLGEMLKIENVTLFEQQYAQYRLYLTPAGVESAGDGNNSGSR